ncbi:MAG: hypothetical protein K2H47_09390 [Muribaculaceae bacterium]|nr:hypothetical protein [Muribaculaceae bacterium]
MTTEEVLDVLHKLGFRPEHIDDDFGYSFEYEGLTLLYVPAPNDDTKCLTIMLPNIFDITEENRPAAYEAMIRLVGRLKYVQPFIMGKDQVWLTYQHYVGDGEVTEDLVEHMIRVLTASIMKFHEIINGEDNDN